MNSIIFLVFLLSYFLALNSIPEDLDILFLTYVMSILVYYQL